MYYKDIASKIRYMLLYILAQFFRSAKVSNTYFSNAILKLGLFGTLKLALALQFIVTNAYFSVARTLTLVLHATLK